MADRKRKERQEPAFEDAPKKSASGSRKKKKSKGPRRSLIGRAAYWSLVIGLWCFIGAIGVIGWVAAPADPVARGAEAPALDPDRRLERPRAGDARRNGRLGGAVARIAAVSA